MKFYLITDTHFNHTEKMMLWCGRPANYEGIIFDSLSKIAPTDFLIHLGDIAIGDDQNVHDHYIKPLQCKKILVKGNHDGKSDTWYLNNGWDFVCDTFSKKFFGQKILFSHIPQPIAHYDLNVHGHFHNSDHRRHEPELQKIYTEKHRLLAIEYTGCRAVELEDFLKNPPKQTVDNSP